MDENVLGAALSYISQACTRRPHPKTFVIASDEMTTIDFRSVGHNSCIAQNSAPRHHIGEHWTLSIVRVHRGRKSIEFFDSLGSLADEYRMQTSPLPTYVSNHIQFQPDKSPYCALYCLYVYYNRIRNRSFNSIMKTFSKSEKEKNDRMVVKFYKNLNFMCPRT